MTGASCLEYLHEPLPGRAQIYLLLDPRNGLARYVGQTYRASERWREHINEAATGGTSAKCEWIKELIALGLEPYFVAVEDCPLDEAAEFERKMIRLVSDTLAEVGAPGLTNGPRPPTIEYRRSAAAHAHRRWSGIPVRDEHAVRERKREGGYKTRKHDDLGRRRISEANQGAANHAAKLTAFDVREIRRRLAAGELGVDMAREFGISGSQVSRIRRGSSWTSS